MYRACSYCGKIHPADYQCRAPKKYRNTEERRLRSSPKYTRKSLAIRERANYLCEVCRDEGRYTYENLEVHHIEKLRDHPELLLEDSNLICLCVEHHHIADAGGIPKDYLRDLARRRDGENIPPTPTEGQN